MTVSVQNEEEPEERWGEFKIEGNSTKPPVKLKSSEYNAKVTLLDGIENHFVIEVISLTNSLGS